MTVTKILALTGLSGSGKTTIANMIACTHNYKVIPFGKALRCEVYSRLDLPFKFMGDKHYEMTHKVRGRTIQEYLLYWGAVLRDSEPDYWIDCWMESYDWYHTDSYYRNWMIVVDDMRQLNEHEHLKRLGATTIRVIRENASREPQPLDHLLDDVEMDITFHNNGTRSDIQDFVETL